MKMTETSQDRYLSPVCSLPLVFRDEHAEVWMWPVFLERNVSPLLSSCHRKRVPRQSDRAWQDHSAWQLHPAHALPLCTRVRFHATTVTIPDEGNVIQNLEQKCTGKAVPQHSLLQSRPLLSSLALQTIPFPSLQPHLPYRGILHILRACSIYCWSTLLSPITFLKQEYLSDSESHGATERFFFCRERKGQHLAAQEEGSQASGFGLYGQISWHSALKSGYQQNRPGHGSMCTGVGRSLPAAEWRFFKHTYTHRDNYKCIQN